MRHGVGTKFAKNPIALNLSSLPLAQRSGTGLSRKMLSSAKLNEIDSRSKEHQLGRSGNLILFVPSLKFGPGHDPCQGCITLNQTERTTFFDPTQSLLISIKWTNSSNATPAPASSYYHIYREAESVCFIIVNVWEYGRQHVMIKWSHYNITLTHPVHTLCLSPP